MNARGSYGGAAQTRGRGQYGAWIGAQLEHVLELSQRYEGVGAAGAQSLLNGLGAEGSIASTGSNRWEVTLRDGAFVLLGWDSDFNILRVTITDRKRYPIQQVKAVRAYFEKIFREKIAPRLTTYGAVAVGLTIYHSVGDRADAVKQMDVDWNALYQNLASQVGELTRDPKSPSGFRIATQADWDANPPDPKKVEWWKSYAHPLINQWVKFKHEQIGGDRTFADDYISFAERFQTNWDVYEGWKKKLDNLRAEAQRRGFAVTTTAPTDLPTTVWADAAGTARDIAGGVGDVWKFVKYAAWGVLGIGAVVALSSVASNLRSGRDPAEKYMALIRTRRSASRARELPEPSRLALPPGEPIEVT